MRARGAPPPPPCLSAPQEQLEHAEVSTALRYLGQFYFKNKLYDEASLCAQRCCDYNDVRGRGLAMFTELFSVGNMLPIPGGVQSWSSGVHGSVMF